MVSAGGGIDNVVDVVASVAPSSPSRASGGGVRDGSEERIPSGLLPPPSSSFFEDDNINRGSCYPSGTPSLAALVVLVEPDDDDDDNGDEEQKAASPMEGVEASRRGRVASPSPPMPIGPPCSSNSALVIRPSPVVVAAPSPAAAATSAIRRPVAVRVLRPIATRAWEASSSTRGGEPAALIDEEEAVNTPTTQAASIGRTAQIIPSDTEDDEMIKVAAYLPPRPRVPRVPALEVLQQPTVPKQAAEAFYGAAHSHGLTGEDVHDAVLLSHEWHRKWTHQHETGHGYEDSLDRRDRRTNSGTRANNGYPVYPPSTDNINHPSLKNPRSSTLALTHVPHSFSTPSPPLDTVFDRYAGAKNPSPEDTFADEPRKRVRSALSELHRQQQGQKGGPPFAMAMAPLLGWPTTTATDEGGQGGVAGPLKPVALRIPRPSTLRPTGGLPRHQAQAYGPSWTELVPQDIFDEMILYQDHKQVSNGLLLLPPGQGEGGDGSASHPHHHHRSSGRKHSPRALSPLTVTSSTGGSVHNHKGGAGPSNTAVAINEPNRVVHFIEPEVIQGGSIKSVLSSASLSTYSSSSSVRSLMHVRRPRPMRSVRLAVREARDGLLEALASSGGCITADDVKFHQSLSVLEEHGSYKFASEEGMWLSLTAPNYFGSLGDNDNSDPRYTLGRMAFDMFSPTSLICSLQGNFNSVERVSDEERAAMLLHVPKALQDEVMANTTVLRTYNVVAAFTIEPPSEEFPDAPNRDVHQPIKGIMTTYGYTLPDPNVPHRLSIWITGGRIEPNGSPEDVVSWKRQFELHPAVHSLGEKAKLLAVKMLMGAHLHPMEADGSMEYTFTRPLGGHGIAYVDTLYCDKSLRIVRGHRGTNFVFTRLPDAPAQ